MEIDIREVPEAQRLEKALGAVGGLKPPEMLTLLCAEDPASLAESLKNILGNTMDVQRMRWGLTDLPWLLHVKKSFMPSAYEGGPE